MAVPWILAFFFVASQTFSIYCQNIPPPPTVSGSYRAIGELAEPIPDTTGYSIQVAFEENYDETNNKSSYSIWELGRNVNYIENYFTNQTLKYEENVGCSVVTPEEWMKLDAPPSLLGYLHDGKIRFSLKKLLSVDPKYLRKSKTNETYRGVPANLWEYEMKSQENGSDVIVTLYSYWSKSTWNSTSSKDSVPLGFQITKIIPNESPDKIVTKTQAVNIFAFIHGAVNKAVFEPREGMYCDGDIVNQFPFPSLPKLNAVSIHSELAFADYQEVKSIDTWYDMKNKLLRIDFDRIAKQDPIYLKQGRRITYEITSQELGATFEMDIYQGKMTCEITPLNEYEFEVQDIINPKLDAKFWDAHHFFGVNTTTYRYIGKTSKRNIPCHIFQGIRTDWPENNSRITSLWEWCFALNLTENDDKVNFRDGELPLVSLQVHFLNSSDEDFPQGFRLIHHFYDVLAEDPDSIYDTTFDVSRCFSETEKRRLQFTVNVTTDMENLLSTLQNATSDTKFLQQWREQILQASKLTIGSFRVAKVRATIYNQVMYVMFILLDVHKDLPNKTEYKSLKDAEKDLRNAIDGDKLSIKYFYEAGKSLDLKAEPKSLITQVDPTITAPTVKPTRPTSTVSVSTEPNLDSSKEGTTGNSPGTVAGVAIAMLIVGISAGAGATYCKFRGVPQVIRRA